MKDIKLKKAICLLLTVIAIISIIPTAASAACAHKSTTKSYYSASVSEHKVSTKCSSCGTVVSTANEKHTFSGNTCTKCGYTKTSATSASVALSATSASGTLGSAGGEIAAEGSPASYTVRATSSGCTVTKIVYTQNGRTYTVNGSSVTITANTDSDFTTTTFTAYTNISGVTATFTVNHKVVKHTTSAVMWETSNTAVIRSITGNGMNKSLSYSMTIPTSYNGQSNLTSDEVATIQRLIGVNDGKTYTVNYTRTIMVYTPASYSSTGSRVNLGTFDGNISSQIEECLSRWGWTNTTAAAIRQAAASSLTFTTGKETDCTAVWKNSETNQQIYSTRFGAGTVTSSLPKTVSVSYSDWPGSGNYTFEKLTYSGDSTGTSTNQSFSMTYTASSKPLTVTFFCHPSSAVLPTDEETGDITVYVRDRESNELLSGVTISGAGKKGTTNTSGGVIFKSLSYGTYSFTATKTGYVSNTGSCTITALDPTKTITIYLSKIERVEPADDNNTGDITVFVRDAETNAVISSVAVYGQRTTKYTSAYGYVTFYDLPYGSYLFTANKSGYESNYSYVTLSSALPSKSATIYLTPIKSDTDDVEKDEDDTGDILIYVRDSETDELIEDVTVEGCGTTKTTSEYGCAEFYDVYFGNYQFTAKKDRYESNTISASVTTNSGNTATIYLTPCNDEIKTTGSITLYVRDGETYSLLSNVAIHQSNRCYYTQTSGTVGFSNLEFGSYTFLAEKSGYENKSVTVLLSQSTPNITETIYLFKEDLEATTGEISIYVKDGITGEPIRNAEVYAFGSSRYTSYYGNVSYYDVEFGIHYFNASAEGYYNDSANVSINKYNRHGEATIFLYPEEADTPTTGTVTVFVKESSDGRPISGASVCGLKESGITDSSGCVTFKDISIGSYSVSAEKSGYERNEEIAAMTEDNPNITLIIYLNKGKNDVAINADEINGIIYRGSTIIVPATVTGDSEIDFTPSNPLTVTMNAKQNGNSVISSQTKTVICPKGESNLVWFAVTIPTSGYSSSNEISFTFEVTSPFETAEKSTDNNISSKTVTPQVLPTRSTPKTSLELTKPSDFIGNVYKSTVINTRTWTVWEWNDGFVKKTYTPTFSVIATLTPDPTAVWRNQNPTTELWTTRSGYGLNTEVTVSCTGVKTDMLAGNAKVNAYYPEFNYSTSASKSNLLLRTSENMSGYTADYSFDADSNNLNNAKMHKTPVWYPDGEYSVKYEMYDLWTPAGMLTGMTYAIVNIEGSMYDDYYTNHN